MTVAAQATAVGYTGNGVTTVFAYTFRILDATYIKVFVNGILQVAGYTVSGVNNPTGGNVTFAVAPANGAVILFQRQTAQDQLVDYTPYDPFPSETHETALDKLTMLVQEGIAGATSALRIPPNEATVTQLPSAALRANGFVAFDGAGNVIVAGGASSVPVTPFWVTMLDDVDGGASIATLIASLAAEATPAVDDQLVMYDTSEGKGNKMRFDDFLKVVNVLTADATPDSMFDYSLTYDASATAPKKVLLDKLNAALPRSYISGLGLANNAGDATNDIDIAVGAARSAANSANLLLTAALTKQLDAAWAVGTNQGGRASGAAIANTVYHVFLIKRTDTGVVDACFDTSVTGANIAANTNANYTEIRRIGSIIRAAGAIRAFLQNGDEVQWKSPVNEVNGTALTTANRTLVTCAGIPTGLKIFGRFAIGMTTNAGNGQTTVLTDPDCTDVVAGGNTGFSVIGSDQTSTATHGNYAPCMTNTSAQIGTRGSAATGYYLNTNGYVDRRGKDD